MMKNNVLVDGRVFSTTAYDRGMGRYVRHILDLLAQQGCDVTLLLFRDCCLEPEDAARLHPLGHEFRPSAVMYGVLVA